MPRRTVLDALRREYVRDNINFSKYADFDSTLLEDSVVSALPTSTNLEHDPHAFVLDQGTTAAGKALVKFEKREKAKLKKERRLRADEMRLKRLKEEQQREERQFQDIALKALGGMGVKAVYWPMESEAKSTLASAKHILEHDDVKWTKEKFIFMFVGGSTIHIGVCEPSMGAEEQILSETYTSLNAKTPGDDITKHLSKLVRDYFSGGKEVKMLLAGSPTMMTTEHTKGATFKFFNNPKTDKVQIIKNDENGSAREKLTYLCDKIAVLSTKHGGLNRGGLTNPGRDILTKIINAMNPAKHWCIVCGNRNFKDAEGKKPYYCTDSTYAENYLPGMITKPFEIISSGDVKEIMSNDATEKRRKVLDRMARINLTLLITAGHTEALRQANVDKVNNKIEEAFDSIKAAIEDSD